MRSARDALRDTRRGAIMLAVALALVASCDRVQADDGLDAAMHIDGARFFRGAMPEPEGGPKVKSVTIGRTFSVGSTGKSCTGELERAGTAVAIGLAGDLGYWVVRADVPNAAALDAPTFTTTLGFAKTTKTGPRQLVVRAVDADQRFGPPSVRDLVIQERALPDGQLVISLSWDNGADLDLHVVDPSGVEIFKRNPSSYEPPPPGGPREPPGTPHDGGVLDFDSNAACVEDGRRAENVLWTDPPPKGHYLVRVDTNSLCGEATTRWRVQALLRGTAIGTSEGVSTEADTRFPHVRGAGLLALEIDVR